jgi:hypothetical protein
MTDKDLVLGCAVMKLEAPALQRAGGGNISLEEPIVQGAYWVPSHAKRNP